MTSINRTSPHFWKDLLKGLFVSPTFAGASVEAMLIGGTTTIPDQWETLTSLDDATTQGEYTEQSGEATHRITLTGMSVSTSGSQAFFSFSPAPIWPSLAVATVNPTHAVFYVTLAGAAVDDAYTDRVPMAIVDADFTPDGTDFKLLMPTGGLYGVETG